MISKECAISTGMISNIISSGRIQSKGGAEDFDSIRQTSLMLKREHLNLDTLAIYLRLHNFVDSIVNISEISSKLNIPIDELYEYVKKKSRGET